MFDLVASEPYQRRLVRMLDIADDHAPRILATSQADLAQKVTGKPPNKDVDALATK